jgi:hypothetical protein
MLMSSCGIFDTREPEPPQTGGGYIWQDATTIGILLDNFEGSVEALDAENYKRVFIAATDSILPEGSSFYTFLPKAGLAGSFPPGWSVESERSYLSRLKSELISSARLNLDLKITQESQTSPYRTQITANYTLFIPSESTDVLPNTVTGNLVFQLQQVRTERGTTEWRITSWLDNDPASGEAFTWSDLKARFGN